MVLLSSLNPQHKSDTCTVTSVEIFLFTVYHQLHLSMDTVQKNMTSFGIKHDCFIIEHVMFDRLLHELSTRNMTLVNRHTLQ